MKMYPLSKNEKDMLSGIYEDAIMLLRGLDIPVEDVPLYTHNSIKHYGSCTYLKTAFGARDIKISFSKQYIEKARKEEREDLLMNTMLHELLHAYCNQKGDYCGHKGTWARLAKRVSRNTSYEITRCTNFALADKNYTYEVVCAGCGKSWRYQRAGKVVSYLKAHENQSRIRCPKCHSNDLRVRNFEAAKVNIPAVAKSS